MTEVEKLMNSTHSGKANLGPEAEAKHKARQKAAREWVQKWAAVDDMITNAVADGFDPAELTEERIIDLSYVAAYQLGFINDGSTMVQHFTFVAA